jgi:hypothetical protein
MSVSRIISDNGLVALLSGVSQTRTLSDDKAPNSKLIGYYVTAKGLFQLSPSYLRGSHISITLAELMEGGYQRMLEGPT